ncbi:MAG: LpqB family beta-propeller domain-containing protein [Mycobacteriales bacterium]
MTTGGTVRGLRRGPMRAATGLLVCVAAGCASMPASSGPIAVPTGSSTRPGAVTFSAPRPNAGESSSDIVRDFIEASSVGASTDHSAARTFLTPAGAQSWNPNSGVTITTGVPLVHEIDHGKRAQVLLQQIGLLDASGSYQPRVRTFSVTLTLEKVHGQRRIARLPPGLIVSEGDFLRLYAATRIYFLSKARHVVVPDLRYFAVPNAYKPDRLLQALIAGPSPWLAPAVATAVPAGTRVQPQVRKSGTTLTVDLIGGTSVPPDQVRDFLAQIVWTLTQGGAGSAIRVTIVQNGQPLAVSGVPRTQSISTWGAYNPDRLPGSLPTYQLLQPSTEHTQLAVDGDTVPGELGSGRRRIYSYGVALDNGRVAAVVARGNQQQVYVGAFRKLVPGPVATSFTRPTWGGRGDTVWTVMNHRQLVSISASTGHPRLLAAPALAGVGGITQLAVSRDGTRAALVTTDGKLYVAAVSADSSKAVLSGLRLITPGVPGVTDVVWASSADLIGIAPPSPAAVPVPWQLDVDGMRQRALSPAGLPGAAESVAAAPSQPTLVSSEDSLYYYLLTSDSWRGDVTSDRNGESFQLAGTQTAYPG